MNERIEEFAERVAYYGQWEGDGIYTGQLDLVGFADLIVRECADVAGRDVGHFVLGHFGLKEQV